MRTKEGKLWVPPTQSKYETFPDWLNLAITGQNATLNERLHEYFRVSSDMGNDWLFNEMPFFEPKKSLLMVDPRQQRGIHCRFGMRNVIAESHSDAGRNAVALLAGLRRWILAHPSECESMYMLPREHPSGRHSDVDWSKPDLEKFPNFPKVQANEVILQPGDVLYVPTYWLHYIVSININIQCNSRSGISRGFEKWLPKCGF